jgi:ABC-type multidrug transport system ATPase subunit
MESAVRTDVPVSSGQVIDLPVAVQGTEDTTLRLKGIVKRWGRNAPPVLDGVDLELAPGSSTWLGGANGVGKTTLLRIATGAIRPEGGHVSLGPLSPESDRREFHRRIAYLAAGDRTLYARLTVYRHLDLWGCLALMSGRERREAIAQALEHFQLLDLAKRRADRLSLGQRQRLRLAGAFLHSPAVALLDEPHTSLDPNGMEMLAAACGQLVARGGAVVWCCPTREEARLEFDRGLVLEDGRLNPA